MWLSMRTDNFTRLLLKYPEHTWGSAGYVNGGIDVDKWANEQFHEAVVREKRLFGGAILRETRSMCQDRLGTNIGNS